MPTPRVTIDELPEELAPSPTSLLVVQDAGTTKKMSFATLQAEAAGPTGPQGDPGQGVIVGGTTGQALVKDSATDYDTEWADVVFNGGGVATIQALSQAAYDALTPDPSTLYIIV